METKDLVYRSENNGVVTDSRIVAEVFGKEHNKVVRDIENLSCSKGFQNANFGVSFIIRELPNGGSRKDRYYKMTKDGFTFLVMGYTGTKAAQFKEAYIDAFNRMEGQLKGTNRIESRMDRMETCIDRLERILLLMLEKQEKQQTPPAQVQHPVQPEPLISVQPVMVSTRPLPEVACKAPVFYSVEELRSVGIQTFTMRVFRNRLNRDLHVTYTSKMLFAWLRWKGFLTDDDVYIHLPSYECYVNGWIFACGSGSFRPNGKKHTVPHFTEKGYRHISNLFKQEIYEKNKTVEV